MVARLIVSQFVLLTILSVSAQDLTCGTLPPSREQQASLERILSRPSRDRLVDTNSTTSLAIVAHIIRRDDGSGGLSESDLQAAIANVNNFYVNASLEFFLLTINYIDDSDYFDFIKSDEAALTSKYNYEQVINIYFANSVGDGADVFFCGYAYFPGGPDVILMDNSCATNGSTLPHEIGHFFALYHTHGRSNTGTTDELVIRLGESSTACVEPDCTPQAANCDTAGDLLCDTEADPNLSGQVEVNCSYTGSETDANGDAFRPDATNIMSYSTKACRDIFSNGQYARMNNAYVNSRNYLRSDNYMASFDLSINDICEGSTVSFNDRSVNAVSYEWSFEGGTPATSNEANPVVLYETSGTYDVSLTITTEDGNSDTKSISNSVSVRSAIFSSITATYGSFEEPSILERISNGDGLTTWSRTSDVSSDGNSSMYLDFYNYDNVGQEDYLIFDPIDTENMKIFDIAFDYAYAPYSESYYDGLALVFRQSCGQWETLWFAEGADLQTAEATTSFFVPSEVDWQTINIQFLAPADVDVVEFALKSINGWGNAVYVDNYTVGDVEDIFSIESATVVNASCSDSEDGAITVNVSGLGSYEYSIDGVNFGQNNEFTNLLPGVYTVTVRNTADETISQSVEILFDNVYPEIPVITEADGELMIILENNQTVQWFLNGNLLSEETDAIISNPQNGTYVAEVFNGSCGVLSDPYIILSISEAQKQLLLYPNPAYDQLQVDYAAGEFMNAEVSISDISGKEIPAKVLGNSIDVSDLKSGIYILQINLSGQIIHKRFVKE